MIQRIAITALLGLLYFGGSASAVIAPTGDADCSGVVDARDAFAILAADVGFRAVSTLCSEAADVNHDGRITAVDALLILQADAGLTVLS